MDRFVKIIQTFYSGKRPGRILGKSTMKQVSHIQI